MLNRESCLLIRLLSDEGRRETHIVLQNDGGARVLHVADPHEAGRGSLRLARATLQRMLDPESGARAFDVRQPLLCDRELYLVRRLRASAYRGEGSLVWVRFSYGEAGEGYTFSMNEWNLLFGSDEAVQAVSRAISTGTPIVLGDRVAQRRGVEAP